MILDKRTNSDCLHFVISNLFISDYMYFKLAYFPGVARVFIYPNLIVICVPSLAEIAHLDGIISIITSTLLGGTLPTRGLIYILLHPRTNYSMAASSLSHHILSLYCSTINLASVNGTLPSIKHIALCTK
jgi:hypothetical protein